MKLIVGQNRRFLKKNILTKKNLFVGKFSYMGAEIFAHQNSLEISKLRLKVETTFS